MPVIRKLWPKFALKDVLKTEVAKTPRFVISYMRPYMWKGDADRVYLPYDLKNGVNPRHQFKKNISLVQLSLLLVQ